MAYLYFGNLTKRIIMNKLLAILVFLSCFVLKMNAQDTILTLEGTRIPVMKYSVNNEFQLIEYTNEKGKNKDIEMDEVFSVKNNETETVMYKMDSSKGDYLCVDDMKSYLRGVEDARKSYGAVLSSVSGLAIGTGAMIYASSKNAKINMFWAPVIPLAFCIGISFTNPCINNIKRSHPGWSNNERYLVGFDNEARKKRVKNAILSSLAGMLVSSVTMLAIQSAD